MAIELLEPVFASAQRHNLTWFHAYNSLDPIATTRDSRRWSSARKRGW